MQAVCLGSKIEEIFLLLGVHLIGGAFVARRVVVRNHLMWRAFVLDVCCA